jgi:class 3 adenylate cyclase
VPVFEAPLRGGIDNRADHRPHRQRMFASVLFTDIVDSVARAWEAGDCAWCDLLERHDQLVRAELREWHGHEIDSAGDGFFAAFGSPGDAVACACSISRKLAAQEIPVRAGIHAAEVEWVGPKLAGIGVLIGARVADQAQAGEVLVSGTVKDLLAGSSARFRERGVHELRGIPGGWPLYAVDYVFDS